MIVVDTSALMAIAQSEPQAEACFDLLRRTADARIPAATLTELLILAARRRVQAAVEVVLRSPGVTVEALTPERARSAAAAYVRWGKNFHPAKLNYGDCFAYALAQEFDCPLLYVGEDFARTDVRSALC